VGQRTLDGSLRSNTVPPKSFSRYHCRHPSIRTLDERFIRSVQVGCSRFSRCCHLIFDLSFHLYDGVGPGVRRSHRNSALKLWASSLCFLVLGSKLGSKLRRGRQRDFSLVAQWFVSFSTDPQPMQQHRQLSRHRDHRSFLPILSPSLRQFESPPS